MIKNNELALYIHYPFCLKKCFYCDFASLQGKNDPRLQSAYFNSINNHQDLLQNSTIKSLFLGGGTPSLISETLLEAIFSKLNLSQCSEISIEINPATANENKIKFFKNIGINRVSIGIQALNNTDLKTLGRIHNLNQALHTIDTVKKYFNNFSLDFIYARPNQDVKSWEIELNNILKLNAPHLSLYQLTIENGWDVKLPDDDAAAQMFILNQQITSSSYQQYEISNYAKNNQYQCIHNLAYWKYQNYLGLGPSAHSRINQSAINYDYNIYNWLNNQIPNIEQLSNKDIFIEKLLMGLRTIYGVFISDNDLQYINQDNLNFLIQNKFIINHNNHIYPTPKGMKFNDYIIKQIII